MPVHPVDHSLNACIDARFFDDSAHLAVADDTKQLPPSSTGEALERAATVALAGVSPGSGVPSTQHRCSVEFITQPVRTTARVGGDQTHYQLP